MGGIHIWYGKVSQLSMDGEIMVSREEPTVDTLL